MAGANDTDRRQVHLDRRRIRSHPDAKVFCTLAGHHPVGVFLDGTSHMTVACDHCATGLNGEDEMFFPDVLVYDVMDEEKFWGKVDEWLDKPTTDT